jgi:hypothetical protein
MVWRQRAFGIQAGLDLERRVTDAEAVAEALGGLDEESVAGVTSGHDQVGGQGNIRRAHGPDVQVVQPDDPGQAFEMAPLTAMPTKARFSPIATANAVP